MERNREVKEKKLQFWLFESFRRYIILRFFLQRFFTCIDFLIYAENHKYREILYLENLIPLRYSIVCIQNQKKLSFLYQS